MSFTCYYHAYSSNNVSIIVISALHKENKGKEKLKNLLRFPYLVISEVWIHIQAICF